MHDDPTGRAAHELDVIAPATDERPHPQRAVIRAIGEAEATNQPRTFGRPDRLNGSPVRSHSGTTTREQTRLPPFPRTGFTDGLLDAARTRDDVELVARARLYSAD